MTDKNAKSENIQIPTLWFDKDGVLAQYDYDIYEAEAGCTPPWLTRNAHVFRHLPAYPSMVTVFQNLYYEYINSHPKNRRYNVKIITAVSNSVTLSEQVLDSLYWIRHNIAAGFRDRDFYAIASPKQNIPVILRHKITPYDILIDDYNPNLKAWKDAGGTSVKAVNDINSENPEFLNVDIMQAASEITEWFEDTIKIITTTT